MMKTIKLEPPSRKEVEKLVDSIGNEEHKALVSIIFLSGARISEIVRSLKPKDINMDESTTHAVITLHTKKRKKGIEIRKLPIRKEDKMFQLFYGYATTKKANEFVFDISRQNALWKLKKYDKAKWFHLFRHARLTELATDLTDQELAQFAGWTDSRPSKNYIHLKWKDLARKI
jgi:integrase